MEKHVLLSAISAKLNQMRISHSTGNGADITVAVEFLDAGWSTGNKKINYESFVFLDDSMHTVFMYEKTTEVGHGLSFGGDSGSSFQSGSSLFRKVKSIQYGPDGKAYEYTLDLGAIPKAVKETAKQYGWKFKTVLNRNKAMYPAGYIPVPASPMTGQPLQPQQLQKPLQQAAGFCYNCGMTLTAGAVFCNKCGKPTGATTPAMQAEQQPQQQYAHAYQAHTMPVQNTQSGNSKGGTFGFVGLIILGVVMLLFLAAGKATPVGWILSIIIITGSFLIQRRLSKKGCLLNLILWIITGFILLVLLTVVTTDSVGVSTENQKNEHVTSDANSKEEPVDTPVKQVFYVEYFSVQWLGYGSKNATDNGVSSYIILSLGSMYPSKVKSIKMSIKSRNNPKQGKVLLYRQNPVIAMSPRYTTGSEAFLLPEVFDINITKNLDDNTYLAYHPDVGGQLRFFYDIIDVPSDKKFTSDDLRTTVTFKIHIETEDGKKHLINFEREFFPDDFMSKGVNYEADNEKYEVADPKIYSSIIN